MYTTTKIRQGFLVFLSAIFFVTCAEALSVTNVRSSSHTYHCINLSLQDYLNQVCQHNKALSGSYLTAKGAHQRIGEGKLAMRPKLFAEGQYIRNSYNPTWSPINGTGNNLQTYQVGVSETTPYGVQGRIYYNYEHQNINGVSPLINQGLNQTSATSSSPVLEVTVPLARNWAGRETRATAALIDSQARLTHYSEKFKSKLLLAQAESTYWRLAITRAILGIQQSSLKRAITLEQWVSHRSQLRLAETSDTLQAQSAVAAKQLDVQVALNDTFLAARAFNTLRGSCGDEVIENLCSYRLVAPIILPLHSGPREDVKALQQQQKIAIANAQLGIEKNKPNLDLFASYAINGNNPDSTVAISESFSNTYPSTAVGLRLSMPLDLACLAKIRHGYQQEIKGAKDQYAQKLFEDQRQWQDLTLKLANAQKRFDLAMQLECLQFKKLQTEKQRLSFGKTTTYQVLMFEQDYANAQVSRLVIQDEIYNLLAQLKTYGV